MVLIYVFPLHWLWNLDQSGVRKLYIADARPRKNALANGAMGGGSESSSNYSQSEVCLRFWLRSIHCWKPDFSDLFLDFLFSNQVVFFGIDNIHAMRESLARLRDYVDTHGTTSSDGMSSFLVSDCPMFSTQWMHHAFTFLLCFLRDCFPCP